ACGSVRAAVQCRRPLRSARRVALDRLGTALAAEPAGVVLSSMDASTGINVAPAAVSADAALRAVAPFEGLKGAWSMAAAVGLLFAGATRLQHWAAVLLARFQAQPPGTGWLQRAISADSVQLAALAIAAYGLVRLLEAWGLWHARAWASWLGCVSATLYLLF